MKATKLFLLGLLERYLQTSWISFCLEGYFSKACKNEHPSSQLFHSSATWSKKSYLNKEALSVFPHIQLAAPPIFTALDMEFAKLPYKMIQFSSLAENEHRKKYTKFSNLLSESSYINSPLCPPCSWGPTSSITHINLLTHPQKAKRSPTLCSSLWT